MAAIYTAIHSGFPRIGDKPREQKLRNSISRWEKHELSREDLACVEDEAVRDAVAIQEKYLDVVTDGQIRWYDPISHLLRDTDGVQINGLIRYYDTNFYFRQPIVTRIPTKKTYTFSRETEYLSSVARKHCKAVLTGPVTLADHSKTVDISRTALLDAFADILANEIRSIKTKYIQLDEPAILTTELDRSHIRTVYDRIRAITPATLILSTFFGDAVGALDYLETLPVDALGIDVTYSPTFYARVKSRKFKKALQLGIADARNTAMEDPAECSNDIKLMLDNYEHDYLMLSPSCSLEFLPRVNAIEKLELLAAIKAQIQ